MTETITAVQEKAVPMSHKYRSVRSRYFATLMANGIRSGISFLTGLVIARGLGPEQFGNFSFLLASFAAIKNFLSMGSSSAFYTFISQRKRPKAFYRYYFIWQAVQFILPALAIGFFIPGPWLNRIWLGHQRMLVLFAFVAVFMQQEVWSTIELIGEAERLTHRVQVISTAVVSIHLAVISVIWRYGTLSPKLLFGLTALEYMIAIAITPRFIYASFSRGTDFRLRDFVSEFMGYCKPLIVYLWLGFAYQFFDIWLLQTYGGAKEQGYFNIGAQISPIGLLATASILRIFWKEVAAASSVSNIERIRMLYKKISKTLFMISAVIGGFIFFWGSDLLALLLGNSYANAISAMMIMSVYVIFSSLGQINATMFRAIANNRPQVTTNLVMMTVSFPLSYFLLAPSHAPVPGLNLGSKGIALKMLLIVIIEANVLSWFIAKNYKWKFEWSYEVIGLLYVFGTACVTRIISGLAFRNGPLASNAIFMLGVGSIFYLFLIGGLLLANPIIFGLNRSEIPFYKRR